MRKEISKAYSSTFFRWISKLLITAILFQIISFLTFEFSVMGIWPVLLSALIVSAVDSTAEIFLKIETPAMNAIKGLIISAIVIYLSQFVVPYMVVFTKGVIISSIAIAVLDYLFPTRAY